MIRRPPRSTLFPSRRSSDLFTDLCTLCGGVLSRPFTGAFGLGTRTVSLRLSLSLTTRGRSEEHTSELQSRLHLVCRLLLEKKKNNQLVVYCDTCTDQPDMYL